MRSHHDVSLKNCWNVKPTTSGFGSEAGCVVTCKLGAGRRMEPYILGPDDLDQEPIRPFLQIVRVSEISAAKFMMNPYQ